MKNSFLINIIFCSSNAWFWLGIWILYYLNFTDYKGIGLIETLQIGAVFLLEIPTGSLADILGKKANLILGMIFISLGNILMALALDFNFLLVAVLFLSLGSTLLSGSWQALLYDSLEDEKQIDKYDKSISYIERNSLIVMAFSSLIGGYLYTLDNRLPFYVTGLVYLIGLLAAVALKVPDVKKVELSVKTYILQLRVGFQQLFTQGRMDYVIKLLLVASLFTILIEVLDPALAIGNGLSPQGLGVLYFMAPIITAIGAHYYSTIKRFIKPDLLLLLIAISFSISLVFSSYLSLGLIVIFILFRNIYYSFSNIIASNTISSLVESKDRATSISTFMAISSLPYAIIAIFVGGFIDNLGASEFAKYLGIIFLVLYLAVSLITRTKVVGE